MNFTYPMTTLRDRVNAHLPIVLQFFSTASLVVIALSAVCGSKSLKELSSSHDMTVGQQIHQGDFTRKHKE